MTSIIIILLGTMNLLGFIMMKVDKQRAIKRQYRIRERTLWRLAICGGGIGIWAGMLLFHHKTKHLSFKIGVPIIALSQAFLYLFLLNGHNISLLLISFNK